jgi:hypothetical protein
MKGECKMNLKGKIAIFMVAVLISLVGFSLIASPSLDVLKVGKEAGFEMIGNYLAKCLANNSCPIG